MKMFVPLSLSVRILNDSLFFIVILKIGYYWASAGTTAKAVDAGYSSAFNSEFFLKNVTNTFS